MINKNIIRLDDIIDFVKHFADLNEYKFIK